MASSFFSSDHCVDSSVSTITHKRNSGRKKFKETRHPIYRGVRERKGSKWVCEMRLNNSNIIKSRLWLGTHISPEMAARAYDIAALALKGKSAQLNFPDSAWLLIRAKSTSATDILSASLVAAQAFRPIAKSVGTSTCVSSLKTVIEIPAALEVVNAFCSTDNSSSTSTCIVLPCVETLEIFVESSPALFLDEEAMFNMPCLLANMAEGMLLSPPESIWDYMYTPSNTDLSLWSV